MIHPGFTHYLFPEASGCLPALPADLPPHNVRSRSHRENEIFALLAVRFWNPKQHPALVNPELSRLANRQEHGMLVVLRPDPVRDPRCLQYVFLAQNFLGVLVLAVRAKDFAGDGLAIFPA